MQSRREFLEMLPAGLLGAGCAATLPAQPIHEPSLTLSPEQPVYRLMKLRCSALARAGCCCWMEKVYPISTRT